MAKPKAGFSMLEQGFNQLETALAIKDPAMGRMVDTVLSKLSVAMARKMGLPPAALMQFARQLIDRKTAQKLGEETTARQAKMAAVQQVGGAERKFKLGLQGLELQDEAFQRKLVTKYVGAALAASGALLGQAIASGMFKAEDVEKKVSGMSDFNMPEMKLRKPEMVEQAEALEKMKAEAQTRAPVPGTRGGGPTMPSESLGIGELGAAMEPTPAFNLPERADQGRVVPTQSRLKPANFQRDLARERARQAALSGLDPAVARRLVSTGGLRSEEDPLDNILKTLRDL
tara:strand:- start:2877 stop:3737 length:861 start_codon:yes stop_codon:yes gene_type:complete